MLFKSAKTHTVRTAGDPVLRQTAARVEAVTPEIRKLAADMIAAMKVFDGIGLAAPQIGRSLRLVVMDVPPGDGAGPALTKGEKVLLPLMPVTLVNPRIISFSGDTGEREEGCLSVPDVFAPVVRPLRVVLQSELLDGSTVELECGGLLGRCIQHELDHLDGVLFTDRLAPAAAARIAGDLERLIRDGAGRDFKRMRRR